MTKKDYILIAETMKYCRPCNIAKPKGYADRMEAWRGTVEELTKRLQEENTRFDASRFLVACGVKKCSAIECKNIAERIYRDEAYCDGHYTQIHATS